MGLCFVPQCNHKSQKDGCSMFVFPKSPKRLARWKKLIRRADRSPVKSSRVCSCHFGEGTSKGEPSIFPWNTKMNINLKKYSPKKKKCRGIAARKLTFPNIVSITGEVPTPGEGEETQAEGRNNSADVEVAVSEDVPVPNSGNDPPEDHITLHDQLINLKEENDRLHARIKELEPLEERVKELQAKMVASTCALRGGKLYLTSQGEETGGGN